MAKFDYRVNSTNNSPGVTMTELSPEAQFDFRRFLSDSHKDSPDYLIKKNSYPSLQGFDVQSGWMSIEFWTDSEKHQKTVDRLLEIFKKHHPDGEVLRESGFRDYVDELIAKGIVLDERSPEGKQGYVAGFSYHLKKLPECSEVRIERTHSEVADDVRKFVYAANVSTQELELRQRSNPVILSTDDTDQSGDIVISLMSHPSLHAETISRLLSIFRKHHPEGKVVIDKPEDVRHHNNMAGIQAVTAHCREEYEKTHGRRTNYRSAPRFNYGPASNDAENQNDPE